MIITYSRLDIHRYGCQSCLWLAEQVKRKFPVPFAPDNFVSRDRFGLPVPRQPDAHSPRQAGSGAYPWVPLPPPAFRQPPSVQSRGYPVTHLRTDDVHRQESARTGPVNLKVVPVTGVASSGNTMYGPICICLFFSSPTIGAVNMCDITSIWGRCSTKNGRLWRGRKKQKQEQKKSDFVTKLAIRIVEVPHFYVVCLS